MRVHLPHRVQIALVLCIIVTFWRGAAPPGRQWADPLALADDDDDKDKDKDKKGFDHFACYDVKCVDRWGERGALRQRRRTGGAV